MSRPLDLSRASSNQGGSIKRPYRTPSLIVFGDVRSLTQSAPGTQPEIGPTPSSPSCANGPGFTAPCVPQGSDRRLKESIVRIGDHPLGMGLYLFDYQQQFRDEHGHGRQFGVMADEVEKVMPEAVVLHSDGFKRVRYDMIGVRRASI